MQGAQIVARIKSLATVQGVPLEKLYADCKVSSSAISQWKNGTTKPSFESIKRIADYLGTTSEYLLFGSGAANNTEVTHKLRLPPIQKTTSPKSGLRIQGNEKSPAPKEGEAERAEFIRLYEAAPDWLQNQVRSLLKAAESGHAAQDADSKDQ